MWSILTNQTTTQDKSDQLRSFSDHAKYLKARSGLSLRKLCKAADLSWQTFNVAMRGEHSDKTFGKLIALHQRSDLTALDHLKKGGQRASDKVYLESNSKRYGLDESAPLRMPNRADCEEYFRSILDAAEREGSPENMPAIYRALKKQFPLSEWEQNSG